MACYHLNDLAQAEDALCEANILNNLDSTVWAYLTLVCLKVRWNCVNYLQLDWDIAMVGIQGGSTISM
ncbi:MAG: hypothetical protein MJE68_04955 [Proteobacteria bacterium]|nr:hypothetical protein [Pseudomonadota bacterium]